MARTAAISLRVEPELKAAAEKAAEDDRRTIAGLVEKILAEWLTERGYLGAEAGPVRAGKAVRVGAATETSEARPVTPVKTPRRA